MRYIGSKQNLLPFIERAVCEHCPDSRTFVDLFCGTAVVGRRFKELGYEVTANDLMAYAHAFACAFVQNNEVPRFRGLDNASLRDTIEHLNSLPPLTGYVSQHFSPAGSDRMYVSEENAGRIDAIRSALEAWRFEGIVTTIEFYILLAALLVAVPSVSNISGTYGAYLKYWESRSRKALTLGVPALTIAPGSHRALNADANCIAPALECDVLYLDPPYNARQYASNYHLLESIALWDGAEPLGVTGVPHRPHKRSRYCLGGQAEAALADIVSRSPARHILLSYNSEGLIPHEALMTMLAQRGTVRVLEEPYRRFRSDADGPARSYTANSVMERLYLVTTQ